MNKLHILVLAFRNFDKVTKLCLESLIPQVTQRGISLTVLDNASNDGSDKKLKDYLDLNPSIQGIYSDQNLGFAGGMNLLAQNVSSQWMMLVGNDTIFPHNFLVRLMEQLDNLSSDIGVLGPLTNEAGNCQKIDLDGLTEVEIFRAFDKFDSNIELINEIYRADFFCVLIRKSLWDTLNGLDTRYGLGYYEDFDFCMRAKQLGMRICVSENLFVFHKGSQGFKQNPLQKKLLKLNKKKFQQRFPEAELRHRRLDNFKLIEGYLQLNASIIQHKSFENLLKIRLQMLMKDNPRTLWKRLGWRRKVARLFKLIELHFHKI